MRPPEARSAGWQRDPSSRSADPAPDQTWSSDRVRSEVAVSRGGVREDSSGRGRARGGRRRRRGTDGAARQRGPYPTKVGTGCRPSVTSPPLRRHRPGRQMGPRGSADPTHEGRDGLPPVRDFSLRRRHRPGRQMGPTARCGGRIAHRSRCARNATFGGCAAGAGTRRQVAAENGQVGRSTRIHLHGPGTGTTLPLRPRRPVCRGRLCSPRCRCPRSGGDPRG